MRPKITRINIPEPCSENWEKMTLEDKGRHCSKCEKTVIDFTQMSDTRLVQYLQNNPNTCGRYYNHQLDREIRVFKNESFVVKAFRRSLLAGVFLSQLWPRKGFAQEIKNDSLNNPSPVNQNIQTAVFIQRTISGRVVQPDSGIYRALKLKFIVDTFNIEIDVSTSGEFSFQLPQGFEKDSIDIQLYTADTVQQFSNVLISQIGSDAYFILSRKELIFQFNGNWIYNVVYKPSYTEITVGAYPWGHEGWNFDTSLLRGMWKQTSMLVTSGFSISLDSAKKIKKDSVFKAPMNPFVKKGKKQSLPMWLLILITFPLIFIIRWFFNGLKNKERQIENQE